MAITNSVVFITPGFGAPVLRTNLAVALSGSSPAATTIPSTGSFTLTARMGWIHIKISGGGGTSPTVVSLNCTATDGTTTEQFAVYNPAAAFSLAANSDLNLIFPFCLDINANTFTVNTTLGGTSPTATLDLEVAYAN